MSDPVHAPQHYIRGGIECIDAIRAALGDPGFVAFCRGNAMKYVFRAGQKDNLSQDLAKADVYMGWAMDAEAGRALQKGARTNGHAKPPARVKAEKAPAKRAPKAAPAPKGKRAERAAEIQRRLAAGEDIKAIAKAVGVSESAIYLHRKKMGKAPTKPKAEAKGGVTFRCAECGQKGYDPVRCDHCQEKR